MRIIDEATRKVILTESRDYIPRVVITLLSGETLELTESEIMVDGISKENAASSDESFSALGSTIISGLDITINNTDNSYSQYEFDGADARFIIYVPNRNSDPIVYSTIYLGRYTIDSVTETDYTIQLSLLDYMVRFDKPYSESTLAYPATLSEIVNEACMRCGISFVTQEFRNRNMVVEERPDDANLTFRDIIGWVASMGCYYAKMTDNYGDLEFAWFDVDNFRTMGFWLGDKYVLNRDNKRTVTYDGTTYQYGNGYHYIESLYSKDINVNRITITGVKVVYNDEEQIEHTHVVGSDDYAIEIRNNKFITASNAASVATSIANYTIGLTFYNANVSHPSNFMMQQGDAAVVYDVRKDQYYPILVTRTVFSLGNSQTTVCGAESVTKNQAVRYSEIAKAYSKAKDLVKVEKTNRELAIQSLSERLDQNGGLFTTIQTDQSGGSVFYLHDQPTLAGSSIIWKMTREAWGVSTNGGGAWNAGLTVDGTFIASVISSIGVFFDYAHGGTLRLGGQNNIDGILTILNASGTEIGRWSNAGITIKSGSINLGPNNFIATTAGAVTAKSLTADDYIYVEGNSNSYLSLPLAADAYNYIEISKNKGVYCERDIEFTEGGISVMGDSNLSIGENPRNSFGRSTGFVYSASSYRKYYPEILQIYPYNNTSNSAQEVVLTTSGVYCDTISTSRVVYSYMEPDGFYAEYYTRNGRTFTQTESSSLTFSGLRCTGTKSRVVYTEDYGKRKLYCYETPSPMFGDVGEGVVNEDGMCYVLIDPTFAETITTSQYQVFLQAYGEGNVYVTERHANYFIVCGTVGLKFGWEIKAKQSDFDQLRLDKEMDIPENLNQTDFGKDGMRHVIQIQRERSVNDQ